MWIANNWKDYEVLDTSGGEKLERWGDYLLVRPDPQVIWDTPRLETEKRPLSQKRQGRGRMGIFPSAGRMDHLLSAGSISGGFLPGHPWGPESKPGLPGASFPPEALQL